MIDPAELAELRAFAVDAARAAGRITLRYFGGDLAVEEKPDATPVTVADRRAEELLRERVADRCPADGIVGEEFGVVEGTSGRRWTLDPIDGTIAFVHGVPLYGVMVGLLDGDESVLGVVHHPALGETVSAARGLGCARERSGGDAVEARVSEEGDLARAMVLATDFGRLPGPDLGVAFVRLREAAGELRTWGDCWGHGLVATGRAEAMIDPRMKPWDSVPLQPIVEEAGGRFTTIEGEARPDGGSAISTNGRVHDRVLDILLR
ncbi:MAG: inositol monophosphatase family protein [Gemmatimonadota bacterium]|nr:inositol monophosphatase family protein [Gemmatimonadota bacterium]